MQNNIARQMDATEAREKTEKIRSNAIEMRQLLLEIKENGGWSALGYANFREYGQVEFGYSERHVYEIVEAAEVERNLLSAETNFCEISQKLPDVIIDSHLRPLAKLPATQQARAYFRAQEIAPNGKPTAAIIQQAVNETIADDTRREKKIVKEEKAAARIEAKTYQTPQIHTTDLFNHCLLFTESVADCSLADNSVDIIITDPPYPKEFLAVYGDLAITAARVLKPGGSMIVMIGQSYLPEILALMTPHIRYHWILSYLTPGGQSTQLWQRKVNTFWKPLLWFVKDAYTGDWLGDVCKSNPNDNDKRYHHWGQSESGMADIIERFTYPKQSIYDPFCGGGATGVVAVGMDRFFYGSDIEANCIATTKDRITQVLS